MKKKRIGLYLAFLVTGLAAIGPAHIESSPSNGERSELKHNWRAYVPEQVLVQYRSTVSEGYAAMNISGKQHSLAKSLPRMDRRKGPMALVDLKGKMTVAEAVKQFENDPDVEYAQPNFIYHASNTVPNDTSYGQLWGMKHTNQTVTGGTYSTGNPPGSSYVGSDIDAELAWDVITDCSAVTVAVIDSGVNYNHEDLSANMALGSYTCPGGTGSYGCDFVGLDGDNDPMDLNGHGTHVAGTIGAVGNNNKGVAGICWKAKILAVRVLDAAGAGTTADIVEGLAFAAGTGAGNGNAKVVNMSLGGGVYDPAFSNAITTAQTNGVVVVVAAGNENSNNSIVMTYPCNYLQDNILCVTAADQRYLRASFSNYSSTYVDIAAPGTNILSARSGFRTAVLTDDFNTLGGLDWTVSTTSGTPWSYAYCSSYYHTLLLSSSCATVGDGTSTTGYASSTNSTAYKSFTLPTGRTGLVVEFYLSLDTELDFDKLNGKYSVATGNPMSSGTLFLENYSGEMNGSAYYTKGDIGGCDGSTTCTIGFNFSADSSGNRSGISIDTFSITSINMSYIDQYMVESGTSMASPHVAGVATMVRARNPNYTYTDTINAILNGGDAALLSPLGTSYTKSGKTLNAYGALKYIPPTEGVVVTTP